MDKLAYWFRYLLEAVIKRKHIFHGDGIVDNMRSQNIPTGYHRVFILRWYKRYGKETQHHELPISAFNAKARLVKENIVEGDLVTLFGELKTHKEIYVELIDIMKGEL